VGSYCPISGSNPCSNNFNHHSNTLLRPGLVTGAFQESGRLARAYLPIAKEKGEDEDKGYKASKERALFHPRTQFNDACIEFYLP